MVILKFEIFFAMKVPMVTTESGLQYKDIKVGEGPSPPIGFQVSELFCKLVLLLPSPKIFMNELPSLES